LSPATRKLLDVICVAGRPLDVAVAAEAADLGDRQSIWDHVAALSSERLIRVPATATAGLLEPFHDTVRELVAGSLEPGHRRACHVRIARILAAKPESHPEDLVFHYREAGDIQAACRYALAAAQSAERLLAFDRAAAFYRFLLEHGDSEAPHRAHLLYSLGDALSMAGRGREAADVFVQAAELTRGDRATELQHLAAAQLLRSGHFDEGMALLRVVSRKVGVRIREKQWQIALGAVLMRLVLHLRGTRWQEQERTATPRVLMRLEFVWSSAVFVTPINPVLGSFLQLRHLLLALRVADPEHLSRGLALSAAYSALDWRTDIHASRARLQQSRDIAERLGDPRSIGMNKLIAGFVDFMHGRVEDGIRHSRDALAWLREHCTGASWETAMGTMLEMFFLGWSGSLKELSTVRSAALAEGRSRGDRMVEVGLQCFPPSHLVALAADDAPLALAETNEAMARWSTTGFHLQHYGALCARVEANLYMGDVARARNEVLGSWGLLQRSLLLRSPLIRTIAFYLRARTALACHALYRNRELLSESRRYAVKLAAMRCGWASPMAAALHAGRASAHGEATSALRYLEQAERSFASESLHLLAAAARRHRGELIGGAEGGELMARADETLLGATIRRPDKFALMLLPGVWNKKESSSNSD
jgi:hypothetical protein